MADASVGCSRVRSKFPCMRSGGSGLASPDWAYMHACAWAALARSRAPATAWNTTAQPTMSGVLPDTAVNNTRSRTSRQQVVHVWGGVSPSRLHLLLLLPPRTMPASAEARSGDTVARAVRICCSVASSSWRRRPAGQGGARGGCRRVCVCVSVWGGGGASCMAVMHGGSTCRRDCMHGASSGCSAHVHSLATRPSNVGRCKPQCSAARRDKMRTQVHAQRGILSALAADSDCVHVVTVCRQART